ncbi:HEPN domain-containing protein [Bosea sp. LjRoot237]|uniref:HEPN domain-containing protein n=1 Tax=Bosea sp. LjRoot237 TaxID=3342292 RepID=UPI003F505CDB
MRSDLLPHLDRIDSLAKEINVRVPNSELGVIDFRSDLAGLLVVAIAANYEACVKETLINFASKNGDVFARYTSQQYSKLNSRVSPRDLHKYANSFCDKAPKRFKDKLRYRQSKVNRLLGKDIEKCYEQILDWRHAYAHAGQKNTTIEEAINTHRYARHVIFAFYDAFE